MRIGIGCIVRSFHVIVIISVFLDMYARIVMYINIDSIVLMSIVPLINGIQFLGLDVVCHKACIAAYDHPDIIEHAMIDQSDGTPLIR
jgi:hypothetical protein